METDFFFFPCTSIRAARSDKQTKNKMRASSSAKNNDTRKAQIARNSHIDDEKHHAKVESLRKIEKEFALAMTLPLRKAGKIKKQDSTWKTYKTRWAEVRGNMLIYKESEQV